MLSMLAESGCTAERGVLLGPGRVRRTRWAERETVSDSSQGVPLAYVRELCGYWTDG